MATKKQVMNAASFLQVDVEEGCGDKWDVTLWSPKGKVFASTGSHCAVVSWFITPGVKEEFWGSVMDELNAGLDQCQNKECEFC